MAHIRKPLGLAVVLNTAVFVLEVVGGIGSRSLALIMDAVHNFSDELALVCLWLAYILAVSMSRSLQRAANALNSLGLVAVSGLLVWQAVERILDPQPLVGWVPIVIGLIAAAVNYGVARTLKPWSHANPAIRLAYLHNLGDTYVSLAPVAAGALVTVSNRPIFDPLIALVVGLWFLGTTIVEIRRSAGELLWPTNAVCPHDDEVGDRVPSAV